MAGRKAQPFTGYPDGARNPRAAVVDGDGTIGCFLPYMRWNWPWRRPGRWNRMGICPELLQLWYCRVLCHAGRTAGYDRDCSDQCQPAVAPTFSAQAMLGTNPIAVAIPTSNNLCLSLTSPPPPQPGEVYPRCQKGRETGIWLCSDPGGYSFGRSDHPGTRRNHASFGW